VPRRGEPTATPPRASAAPGSTALVPTAPPRPVATPLPTGPLDINSASAGDLERLPGVGPKLAQAIVEYRAEHGPFAGPAQLAEVKGISERLIATWGEEISYGP
jgi:competence protein ComEA